MGSREKFFLFGMIFAFILSFFLFLQKDKGSYKSAAKKLRLCDSMTARRVVIVEVSDDVYFQCYEVTGDNIRFKRIDTTIYQ